MEKRPDAFRQLKGAHLALLGIITAITIAAIVLLQMGFAVNKNETLDRTLQAVLVLLALISIVTGFNLFRKKILQVRALNAPGETRMLQYRKACIVWWLMIVLPGIFAASGFLITGNYAFLALTVFLISVLAIFMPRKQNIILLLNLTDTEVARLEGK